MKFMRRLFSVLVLSIFALSAGVVFSVRRDTTSMEANIESIFALYQSTFTPALSELRTTVTTAKDQGLVDRARALLEAKLPGNLQDNVQYVATLQHTLRDLAVSLGTQTAFSGSSTLALLETETSPKGVIAGALTAYNELALAWNQRDRSTTGQWVSSLLKLQKVYMLNPDGKSELVPTIKL